MVVGGTFGLDRTHADPARSKRADNRMVWTLGQSALGAQSSGSLLGRLAQRWCSRSRWPNRQAVRRTRRERTGPAAGGTAHQTLPPTSGTARLDTETWDNREAPAGHSRCARSDSGSGDAKRTRTDLRARFRRAQLRVSAWAWLSR